MKRTPIKRTRPMRRGVKRSRYAMRERNVHYMLWVKTLPCVARSMSQCDGVVEADHAGQRGLGRKSIDEEVIPICTGHHKARTDHTEPFRSMTRVQMREWLIDQITDTQSQAIIAGLLKCYTACACKGTGTC